MIYLTEILNNIGLSGEVDSPILFMLEGYILLSPKDVELLQSAYPNIVGTSDEYLDQFRNILGIPEPIYEWQWVAINEQDTELARSSFMTEQEFRSSNLNNPLSLWIKDESTKRERIK